MKFLKCKTCGVIVGVIQEPTDGVPFCGGDLEELIPNTTDAAGEKHVPVIDIDGSKVTVTVGEVEHPMLEAHSIQWIALETKQGMQRKPLARAKLPRHRSHWLKEMRLLPLTSTAISMVSGRQKLKRLLKDFVNKT